ncbi:thioesterase [Rhodococcus sp. Leaf7]|uniref:PaaI family thioesterase n=1 Tax=unclassified Rhodococcus (in: high G+C Gram-positive bacteria) TaxID=192944 RepID=UPI0005AC1B9C|nr:MULTISPECIES: PaaI family thioesterase [unclassified Rhodococcus (in: high G+C Gram-positive bacteria)]KIQ14994.1 thioesterase [Rhodococcus sp. MEB064]KQU03119.1 thioesterase [Rhodococcus sp. Leaf7]KQU38920.1 thioesterase [Rhodococcus sp. Leaf247]
MTEPTTSLDDMRAQLDTGFGKLIGLEFHDLEPDRVTARWTVRDELLQPFGIVHGGVHCSVIESVASTAAALWLGGRGHVVGVNNTTDFIRAARAGVLTAEAVPVHRGRTQQIWTVTITDESDRLIARGQVRLQNIEDTAAIGGA